MVKGEERNGRWVLALTGASGACYALRAVSVLSKTLESLDIVISEAGLRVLHEECDFRASHASVLDELVERKLVDAADRPRLTAHHPKDIGATVASGSVPRDGMVIVPCSMGTVGAIARGIVLNLVHRAAEVTMKENRPLILVPRESPLSPIHLENMLTLSRLGVSIAAAMPGFYTKPSTIDELVDAQVMKLLDLMRVRHPIGHSIGRRWKDADGAAATGSTTGSVTATVAVTGTGGV